MAARELIQHPVSVQILEATGQIGGISQTVEQDGYRFDIGGHRFFTKVEPVQQIWEEIMGDDFLLRPRLSRILYRGRFFDYPLNPVNALIGLGPVETGVGTYDPESSPVAVCRLCADGRNGAKRHRTG